MIARVVRKRALNREIKMKTFFFKTYSPDKDHFTSDAVFHSLCQPRHDLSFRSIKDLKMITENKIALENI